MKNKRKIKRFKMRHVLFLLVLIYGVSTFMNQEAMMRELDEKRAIKDTEIEQLKSEIIDSELKLEYVHSYEYLEKLARERLGMVKPNEKIFIDKNKNKFVKGIKD